jgi:hypothetical protein
MASFGGFGTSGNNLYHSSSGLEEPSTGSFGTADLLAGDSFTALPMSMMLLQVVYYLLFKSGISLLNLYISGEIQRFRSI